MHDDSGSSIIIVILVHGIDASLFHIVVILSLAVAVADKDDNDDCHNDSCNNSSSDGSCVSVVVVVPAGVVVDIGGVRVVLRAGPVVVTAIVVAAVVVATHFLLNYKLDGISLVPIK